jgi:uncharacterized protein YndB with AHSA1/START domain
MISRGRSIERPSDATERALEILLVAGSLQEIVHGCETRRVSAHRQQAHLDVPVATVWDLVGAPSRYPEWWPRVIEVRGQRYEEGDEFVQVIRSPSGEQTSNFLIDQRDDLHEIRMTCQLTGLYAHWMLTPAGGGTFVEVELGIQPQRVSDRVLDAAVGRMYFRRWCERSLAGLEAAAQKNDA